MVSDVAIDPMSKSKAVRGSLIDAVDKINEIITAVNALSPSSIAQMQQDIAALQAADVTTGTRIDGLASRVTATETTNTSQQSDIDAIKVTLYTPLSSGENPSNNNGGN